MTLLGHLDHEEILNKNQKRIQLIPITTSLNKHLNENPMVAGHKWL